MLELEERYHAGASLAELVPEIQTAYDEQPVSLVDRGTLALLLATYYQGGQRELALQYSQDLQSIAEKTQSEKLLIDSLFIRAVHAYRENDLPSALALTTSVMDRADALRYHYRSIASRITLAGIASRYGAHQDSIAYLSEALPAAATNGYALLELRASSLHAELCLVGGDYVQAKQHSLHCIDLARKVDLKELQNEQIRLAAIALELKDYPLVEESISAVQRDLLGVNIRLSCSIHNLRGTLLLAQGKKNEALKDLTEALQLTSYPGSQRVRSNIRIHLSDACMQLELIETALEHALAAVKDANSANDRFCKKEALRVTHQCYRRLGSFEEAYRYLEEYNALVAESDAAILKTRLEFYNLQNALATEQARANKEQQAAELLRLEIDLREREVNEQIRHRLNQAEALRQFRKDLRMLLRQTSSNDPVAKNLREKLEDLPEESVDWLSYESKLSELHPEFKSKLQSQFPTLTKQEIKICQLARLGLKSFETAKALSISERTVDNHRNAIRKKLTLHQNQNLTEYLKSNF